MNTTRAMLEAFSIKSSVMASMEPYTSFFEAARMVLAKRLHGKRGRVDWILGWEVTAFVVKEPKYLEAIYEMEQRLISGEAESPFYVRHA